MKRISLLALAVLAPAAPLATHADEIQDAPATRSNLVTKSNPQSPQGIIFPHSLFDLALARTVDKTGTVDYAALKGDKDLARYIEATAGADLTAFPTWPIPADPQVKNSKPTTDRSAELVFWINAYNAHVLKTLSDAYPISSPDEIKNFDTAKTHRIAGKDYSFAGLREIIARFDPRALFALTDGTLGGPMLAPAAYRFHDLNFLLTNAVNTFVNDDRNVEVLRIANKVSVSDYFADANTPFTPAGERRKMAGVRYILSAYSQKRADRSYLTTNDYQITLKPRDRTLNKKAK